MPDATITLDPDLFMALGLSAEAHGGVGAMDAFRGRLPCCIVGHATWLDGEDEIWDSDSATSTERELWDASPWSWRDDPRVRLTRHQDDRLQAMWGGFTAKRVPFAKWCEIVGADVANA